MSGIDHGLRTTAEAWVAEDPDPATRAEIARLLEQDDAAGLAARFAQPLTFGTAGIRGPLGAGPARMNRAVVRRVVAGLAAWLGSSGRHGPVVVGYDVRHGSTALASEAAAVLVGAGRDVHRFDGPVPTPLLAFTVRATGAAAGVQVTASHNPPADNGVKVYVAGGLPLGAPSDAEIAAAAEAAGPLSAIPIGDPSGRPVPPELRDAYLAAVCAAAGPPTAPQRIRLVVTPLHGVAGSLLSEALLTSGFAETVVVPEQADPEPDFPTVRRPNPEEPGVLDLALRHAVQRRADLVLATDPDGDRIAVAVPAPDGWRPLTGDEAGCLLAEHLLERDGGLPGQPLVATTIVSSRLLRRIADAHDATYVETLTGFKWLAPVAEEAAGRGQRFVLAYEQALGIMIGDAVRDKDGIAAAVAFAVLASELAAQGATVRDALDGQARRYGVHATTERSVETGGAAEAAALVARLRDAPPRTLVGTPVVAVTGREDGPGAGGGVVELDLGEGTRCLARPSGTEPRAKLYVEVVEPVAGDDVAAARRRAAAQAGAVADAFLAALRPR